MEALHLLLFSVNSQPQDIDSIHYFCHEHQQATRLPYAQVVVSALNQPSVPGHKVVSPNLAFPSNTLMGNRVPVFWQAIVCCVTAFLSQEQRDSVFVQLQSRNVLCLLYLGFSSEGHASKNLHQLGICFDLQIQ